MTREERRTRTARIVRRRLFWSYPGLPAGWLRKRHPLACGRPGCQLCHWDKIFDVPRHADVRRFDPDRES